MTKYQDLQAISHPKVPGDQDVHVIDNPEVPIYHGETVTGARDE